MPQQPVAGIALDRAVLAEVVTTLGSIPIADYGTPSTSELADAVRHYIRAHDGLLLANHGALTVAEVAAAGVAALFVPLPSAVDDHQTLNARWLVDRGAALMLPQAEMNAGALARSLAGMMERDALAQIARRARQLAVPDSAARVAKLCEEVAHGD